MLIGTGHAARARVRALLRTIDNCDRTVASRRLPLPLVCPFLYSVPCRVSVKAGGSVWTAGSIPISGWPLSGLVPADGLTKRINCTEVQPSQKRAALIGSGAFSGARLFLRGEKKKKRRRRSSRILFVWRYVGRHRYWEWGWEGIRGWGWWGLRNRIAPSKLVLTQLCRAYSFIPRSLLLCVWTWFQVWCASGPVLVCPAVGVCSGKGGCEE